MDNFIAYILAILSFFIDLTLQLSVQGLTAPQCKWNPSAPQVPWERAICSTPVDDKSPGKIGQWQPWTDRPHCSHATRNDLCVFTCSSFRGQRGVSLIASPVDAANVAKAMEDPYYTWERGAQSLDPRNMQKRETAAWELKGKPAKGMKVVAKRTIQPGEVIMLDYPVLITPSSFANSQQEHELLKRAASYLPEQPLLYNLSRSSDIKYNTSLVQSVIKSNAFTAKLGTSQYMLLYPKISRVNHACAPVAVTRFSPSSLSLEVVATKVIKRKQEITISYIPPGLTSERRKASLKQRGLQCSCDLCKSKRKSSRSDNHRQSILVTLKALQAVQEDVSQKTDELAHELLRLVESEGLTSNLGDYFELIALAYVRSGHIASARDYVTKSLNFWNLYDGHDGERVNRATRFLKRLNEVERIMKEKEMPPKTRAA